MSCHTTNSAPTSATVAHTNIAHLQHTQSPMEGLILFSFCARHVEGDRVQVGHDLPVQSINGGHTTLCKARAVLGVRVRLGEGDGGVEEPDSLFQLITGTVKSRFAGALEQRQA